MNISNKRVLLSRNSTDRNFANSREHDEENVRYKQKTENIELPMNLDVNDFSVISACPREIIRSLTLHGLGKHRVQPLWLKSQFIVEVS